MTIRARISALLVLAATLAWGAAGMSAAPTAAQGTPPSAPPTAEKTPADNTPCLICHQEPGLTLTFPTGEVLPVTMDGSELMSSVHAELACTECHTDIRGYPHGELPVKNHRELQLYYSQSCVNCHEEQALKEVDSVHAQLQASGVREAAVCADCHGSHNTQRISSKHADVPRTAPVQVCRQCHSTIAEQFVSSVHGVALFAGDQNVPTCTTCHPAHTTVDMATLIFQLRSPNTCGQCHGDKELMARYGISTEVFDTYVADFHGTTVLLFEKTHPDQPTNKAVCVDCHGVHDIAPATRDSEQMRANILPRCQECHPDASTNFAASWLGHYAPDFSTAPLVTAVTWFYRILIPGVVGFFVVYVGLDFYRHLADRRAGHKEVQQ